jgi:AraC-like DNA-binding protein
LYNILFVFSFKKSSLRFLAEQRKIVDNWLIFFTVLVSLLGVFLFTFCIMFLNLKDKITFQYEGNVLFSLIFSGLLVLILGLILFPRILYGIPTEKITLIVGNNEMDEFDKVETESISFDLDYIEKIRLLLENWAAEFKFLDVDSSIYSISKDIDLPFHHVTYFFNQVNNEKFIDWRNKLRIEHSVKLLENKEGYNKTIASLGKESGFKSNSAFIQNFKKITGKLPSEFIKEL